MSWSIADRADPTDDSGTDLFGWHSPWPTIHGMISIEDAQSHVLASTRPPTTKADELRRLSI